ncbi:MAG: hypothetical protein AB1696_19045 [Planctomycetota bacterium]
MRRVKMATLVVVLLGGVSLLMADGMKCEKQKTAQGAVKAVSPCGTVLKVTAGGETLTLQAGGGGCPNAAAAMKEQVQGLKPGSAVKVTYTVCPKTKKCIITSIEEGGDCPKK